MVRIGIKHNKEECFIRYPDTKKWVEKTRRSRVFFLTNFEVSLNICDETLFRVFDIASQIINNSQRKSKQKFAKSYDY